MVTADFQQIFTIGSPGVTILTIPSILYAFFMTFSLTHRRDRPKHFKQRLLFATSDPSGVGLLHAPYPSAISLTRKEDLNLFVRDAAQRL